MLKKHQGGSVSAEGRMRRRVERDEEMGSGKGMHHITPYRLAFTLCEMGSTEGF